MAKRKPASSIYFNREARVIELFNNNLSLLAVRILLAICIICLSVPVVTFILLLSLGSKPFGYGFIISAAVFLFSFAYLFRLYLWYQYGKEVFIIESGVLIHYYDYKLFISDFSEEYFTTISMYFFVNNKWQNIAELYDIFSKNTSELKDAESPIRLVTDNKVTESYFQVRLEEAIKRISKFSFK